MQPDTVIPDLSNPQNWNHYSYTSNNPSNLIDPTGHDGIAPAGNVITLNIGLGLNIGPLFLAYYSLSLVTDNKGGFQFYGTKRDQTFHEGSPGVMGGFEQGPAEKNYKTGLLAVGGLSITYGAVEGSDFRERGTKAFNGRAVINELGVGPVSGDYYAGYNNKTGKEDPSALRGWDAGVSIGGPLTIGSVATESTWLSDRHQLPSWMLPSCKNIGLCGSSPPPLSYVESSRQSIKSIRNWISNKILNNIPSPIHIE